MTAKTRAIPSLHRDSFLAKVPGPCPDAASGNTTSPYCRAVMLKQLVPRQLIYRDKIPKHNSPNCNWPFNLDNFVIDDRRYTSDIFITYQVLDTVTYPATEIVTESLSADDQTAVVFAT
jgi:hypothetical protein